MMAQPVLFHFVHPTIKPIFTSHDSKQLDVNYLIVFTLLHMHGIGLLIEKRMQRHSQHVAIKVTTEPIKTLTTHNRAKSNASHCLQRRNKMS